ncbi:MAG: ABC transporter permease [Terricaulis sp.]|nr:ABC transporter permease [Terricaulis sp.]
MILQVLMPLVIIFLGFSAFSGERERGTLRQLLSIGVPRGQLLWGKALGIGAAVALVVVPCMVLGAVAIALLEITPSGDAFGARVGLLFAFLPRLWRHFSVRDARRFCGGGQPAHGADCACRLLGL